MRFPTMIKQSFYLVFCCVSIILISSCSSKPEKQVIKEQVIKEEAAEEEVDADGVSVFLNRINSSEADLPYVGHFRSSTTLDTLDFNLTPISKSTFRSAIFIRGVKQDSLIIDESAGFTFYKEGDLDGDGLEEIGILPGWLTSACRSYYIWSFKNRKWKNIHQVETHLPDRAKGVDYFKLEGNKLRIISADDGCCQCLGLDTLYKVIKRAKVDDC